MIFPKGNSSHHLERTGEFLQSIVKDGKQQIRFSASANAGDYLYHSIIFSLNQLMQVSIPFNLHHCSPFLCIGTFFSNDILSQNRIRFNIHSYFMRICVFLCNVLIQRCWGQKLLPPLIPNCCGSNNADIGEQNPTPAFLIVIISFSNHSMTDRRLCK